MSIILTTKDRKLVARLSAATTPTIKLPVVANGTIIREGDAADGIYGCELTELTDTPYVTVFAAPRTGMSKELRTLTCVNLDSVPATVEIALQELTDGVTLTEYTQVKVTLAAGDSLYYEHEVGWSFKNSFGSSKGGLVEMAQDAVGGMILDTATIDLVYTDPAFPASPSLEAFLIVPGTNAGDIIYRTGANTIGAEPAFTYDSSTNIQTVDTVKAIVGLVVPKTSGLGIKVDTATPTFPWQRLDGHPSAKGTGATDPAWNTYRGNIKEYEFAVNDEIWYDFTIPHDYVPGTDLWVDLYWSHISTLVTGGNVTWGFDITYAKANNQAVIPATVNATIVSNASTTQYRLMTALLQISATSPSGSQIDSDDIEPGGLLLFRSYLSANGITSSGAVPDPFQHDVHVMYQSTNVGTKNKQDPFYT